ncbi:MAG: LysM domain-containing protein [Defluviitaleaceae bacterium]|nr:LysM domain-containing protein [Defluviitaleaceae bacterium]
MNPTDGNEFDNDNVLPTDTLTDDEYIDAYDEKRGRNAVGRLFDEDDEIITPIQRAPARTAEPVAPSSDDFLSKLNDNRNKRGERPRPVVAPAVTPSRKIERPGVRNPEPKPAMRARVAVTREPVPSRHLDDEHDASNIGEDVDSFKNRYGGNRDALGTARDPGVMDRNGSDDRVVHPAGIKPRARTSKADYDNYQSSSPIRWIALAGVLAVLIVMIVMVFQHRSLINENNELRAQLNAGGVTPGSEAPPYGDPGDNGTTASDHPGVTALQMDLEVAREALDHANEDLETLKNFLIANGYNVEDIFDPPADVPEPPPPTPDPTEPPPPPPHQYHTVAPGQTLSQIARLFYDNASLYPIIMEANGITNPAQLQANQRLIIPRLP